MFDSINCGLLESVAKDLGLSVSNESYCDDIIEFDDKVVVELEVPGFKKSDVDIAIKKDSLTVTAKKTTDTEGRYVRQSRTQGELSKTYIIAEGIDVENIKATLEDGLLVITFPKGGSSLVQKIIIS
jgi:HSP20 family molecular chaperone IbpA